MILDPGLDLSTALAQRLAQLNDTGAYRELWDSLQAIDSALLVQINNKVNGLYGQDNLVQLSEKTGKAVSVSQVQKALARLMQKDLTAKTIYGKYMINDQAFSRWIQQQSSAMHDHNVR